MAFALNAFKAYGIRHEGATRNRQWQACELHISAANTDTAYDIDNPTGTFWTSALANTTKPNGQSYTLGQLATTALTAFLTTMKPYVKRCIAIDAEPLVAPYVLVASGASGQQYTRAIGATTAHYPSLAFVSGSAPTAITIMITFTMPDGVEAFESDLGLPIAPN